MSNIKWFKVPSSRFKTVSVMLTKEASDYVCLTIEYADVYRFFTAFRRVVEDFVRKMTKHRKKEMQAKHSALTPLTPKFIIHNS